MAEFASEDLRESVQRGVEHPSGELQFRVLAALGLGCQILGVGHRGGEGAALLNFTEVVGFVERKQVYAHRSHVSGNCLQQSGSVTGIHGRYTCRTCSLPEQVQLVGKGPASVQGRESLQDPSHRCCQQAESGDGLEGDNQPEQWLRCHDIAKPHGGKSDQGDVEGFGEVGPQGNSGSVNKAVRQMGQV